MRDKNAIENTETIGFIVGAWAKGVEEGGQAESGAGCLGWALEV